MRLTIISLIFIAFACGGTGEKEGRIFEKLEEQEELETSPEKSAVDLKVNNGKDAKASKDEEEKTGITEAARKKMTPVGDWTNLALSMPDAKLDIRYATTNNFVKKQMYECPTCWLRPDAAVALKKVQEELKSKNYNLVLFDCYRPRPVQQELWDIMPNAAYVTPPSRGSMHNRGKAIDLSLTDLEGNQLDMGTPFDFFGRPAHSDNRNHPKEILERRDLLTNTMIKYGFRGIRTEWWHFSFGGKRAELSDELWPCDH